MTQSTLALSLGACLLSVPVLAQDTSSQEPLVALKYATFDPAESTLEVPADLRGGKDTNLWIVQFTGNVTDAMRNAVQAAGAEVHSYLPENAYVVRMPAASAVDVRNQLDVRSVTYYHPAFRLEAALRLELANNVAPERRYNIVVVDKHRDKPALARRIAQIGGTVDNEQSGSLLFEVTLDQNQLRQAARFDEVLWIDRWGAPEDDMDNARRQGGGDYVESQGGWTGTGITGHQMEGLNPSNVDWTNRPIGFPAGCGSNSSHGHSTAGIVYGNGSSSSAARGMAPDAQCIFTSCRTSRYSNLQSIISTHQIMFTTASWGSPRTRQYTSVSAEADDICFDLDLVWTNSQSNAGNQDSRAEAWGKNVMACGGINHANNSNPNDDSWQNGNASIGPAADGRTRPDLCAYYDSIITSSSAGGTTSFGGTSGATPIVAGHNALALQMYTDGIFGNTLRNPGGSRFSNKPKFPTLKALQIVSADQYTFNAGSADNKREHQGYGFPNLRNMYDDRQVMFIVDEEDVLQQGEGMAYTLSVPAGRQNLKVSMSFSDPAGNPAATLARVNDLTLRVTSPSGVQYWGNAGLATGMWSTTGGTRDRINTAEQVFVPNPEAGDWTVDVIAYIVAQDGHVETAAMDADFGLVARGATFVAKAPFTVQVGSISKFGQGCPGSVILPPVCASNNPNGGVLTQETRQWEYTSEATAATALSVDSFEIFSAAVGGTATQNAAIYFGTSGPSGAPVATTTIRIASTPGFYTATFATPVVIPAGQRFYCAVTHNNATYIPTLTSGAGSPGYFRNASGVWTLSGLLTEPSFRVNCSGGSQTATPTFELTGTPEVGQSLTARLSVAAPNAPVTLLIGETDQALGSIGLPFDLTPTGAPGCMLYTSGDWPFPGTTNTSGVATSIIRVPNDPTLVGFDAYFQYFIIDPTVNNIGVVSTDAAALVIGG